MKKALIVGINDYAPVGAGGPDLRGCVNDASDMANTLVICGFPAANIRILTNRNATRANIITYLRWLLANNPQGSSIVFYYSGHGTRVTNIGPDLELDGLDEAIVPHDYATAGVLRDDDLNALFRTLGAGVNLEVFLDSCFSGTGTRDFVLKLDGISEVVVETPRFLEPMLEDEFYYSYQKELKPKKESKGSSHMTVTKALVPVAGLNHTLWAACKDNQVSMEGSIGGVIRGYFTYHLCRFLRATSGNILRRTLDSQVAAALRAMGAAQINQTESVSAEFAQRIFM